MADILIYLFIGGFVLAVVAIVTAIVVRNGKPTINNYGTIHNHYYGQEAEEKPTLTTDEKILLIAQSLNDIQRELRGGEENNRRKNRRLNK